MKNVISNISRFIEKIGKVNFILLVFIIGVMVVIGLYGTLAADTSDNYALIAKTYKFIIGDKSSNEVIIAANDGKYMDITISNPEKIDLQYALYYNSTDTDFEIGYIKETEAPTSGNIKSNSEVIVSIYVRNNSTSDVTIGLGIDYGTINGGDISVSGTRIENEISPYDLLSDYVIDLYNNGSTINTVNIGGDTSNPTVSLNANQGLMLDNNGIYRYYGANPDNYVEYNDELWRIISVSYEDDGTGSYNRRVKIIKDEILEDDNGLNTYSYDSSASDVNSGYGVNDWSQADMMTMLNSLYYNSTSGTCYIEKSNSSTSCIFSSNGLKEEAQNLIGDAVYYLGGNPTNEELYADDYYTFERMTNVWPSTTGNTCNDGACPRATTWTGRIGIMYPSDYAYATDLNVCLSDGYNYSEDTNCTNTNWLYNSVEQWSISPRSSDKYGVFRVYLDGDIEAAMTYYPRTVRPVQYLKSNVVVTSGNGTKNSPYQIELSNREVDSLAIYTVSYDANGGSGAASSQIKFEGSSLTLSSTIPTRDGYTFVGWATSADATSAEYQAGDSYTTDASITLYAVWGVIASTYIQNLYSSATLTSVTTTGGEAITQASSVGLMQDSFGNIRYYGASPNNYVTFNGEDAGWRIISVSDVEDENGNIEKRVRLIRNESIGAFAYDNKLSGVGTSTSDYGSNDWSDARLMMLLNPGYETTSNLYAYEGSLYWNSKSGTCYADSSEGTTSCDFTSTGLTDEGKSMIGKAKYYLGGNSTESGLYADDYYNFERGTTVYSGHATEWTGYVGIMYPSDYVYAADLSVCTRNGYYFSLDKTNCTGTDWLFNSESQWTIAPYSSNVYFSFYVNSSGYVTYKVHNVSSADEVRPVVVLESDVNIVGGTGSFNDPYTISLA